MYKFIDFKLHKDNRGYLVPIENNKDIPFQIKRIYYIWGSDFNMMRGCHAHYKLKEVLIPIVGNCIFKLDDGENVEQIFLSDPTKGLYIPPYTWLEFTHFSKDCVLLALTDDYYNDFDYIRDYNLFKKEIVKHD